MAATSIINLPEPLTDLPTRDEANGLDLMTLFRARGVNLGNPTSAQSVIEAFGVVDQAATALHHHGRIDDRALGHILQMLAGLSLAVSDAHYIANQPIKTQ